MPAEWDDSDGVSEKSVPCPHEVTIRSRHVNAKQVALMAREIMDAPGTSGHFWFERIKTGRESGFDKPPITFHFSDENTAFEFKLRNG